MADITNVEEEVTKTVTHRARPPKPIDPTRLKASLESTKGIKHLPEQPGSLPTSLAQEYPREKEFPTEEVRKKAMASLSTPPTISPEDKSMLTEEARRFTNRAMGTYGEGEVETKDLPHSPPFVKETPVEKPPEPTGPLPAYNPEEHLEAKGGAAPLKRALEAEEELKSQTQDSASESPIVRSKRIMQEADRAREQAQANLLRPKTYEEMATSRRGDVVEKANREALRNTKETGPLPSPPPRIETPGPKAEDVLREQMAKPPQPPQEKGLKAFLKRLVGRG